MHASVWFHVYDREMVIKTLIQAFVISKLDCGNALLSGVSTNLLHKLQRVQNMAARVITFTPLTHIASSPEFTLAAYPPQD